MSESKTEVQEGAETVHVMKTTRKLRLHTKTIIGVHWGPSWVWLVKMPVYFEGESGLRLSPNWFSSQNSHWWKQFSRVRPHRPSQTVTCPHRPPQSSISPLRPSQARHRSPHVSTGPQKPLKLWYRWDRILLELGTHDTRHTKWMNDRGSWRLEWGFQKAPEAELWMVELDSSQSTEKVLYEVVTMTHKSEIKFTYCPNTTGNECCHMTMGLSFLASWCPNHRREINLFLKSLSSCGACWVSDTEKWGWDASAWRQQCLGVVPGLWV